MTELCRCDRTCRTRKNLKQTIRLQSNYFDSVGQITDAKVVEKYDGSLDVNFVYFWELLYILLNNESCSEFEFQSFFEDRIHKKVCQCQQRNYHSISKDLTTLKLTKLCFINAKTTLIKAAWTVSSLDRL